MSTLAAGPIDSGTAAPVSTPGADAARAPLRVALIGNPNTGKTTLFNALTGLRQKVANYAGVTVERVEGSYRDAEGRAVLVTDLPGTYSLTAQSPDETIALDVLLGRARGVPAPDVVVVVADALHLERNLFLVSQVMELGRPTVVALNQIDAAEAAGVRIDIPELIHELGITVIPTVATRREGLDRLRHAVSRAPSLPLPARRFVVPSLAADALAPVERWFRERGLSPEVAALEALRVLTTAVPAARSAGPRRAVVAADAAVPQTRAPEVTEARHALQAAGLRPDSLEAELRYGWITGVVERTVVRPATQRRTTSDRIDDVLLHRLWGPLIFLVAMAFVFQSIFTWAAPLQDAMAAAVGWLGGGLAALLPPGDLRSLLVDGVVAGVGNVVVFLPQIAILFLCIGVLEDSGYMARAAFLMDRYMRRVGLSGRSFIPLLSGYACGVPAVMATRTIESPRDRLATIMVIPLISCSARLPIYTLLVGAFIPPVVIAGIFDLQGLTMLGIYLLGTGAALVMATLFKRTLLRGTTRPMIVELPPYRLPDPRSLAISVSHRAMLFLKKAGTVILAFSTLVWALASYPKTPVPEGTPETAAREQQLANSILGQLGHAIKPAVRPLGYDWKIGVAMLTSFTAREVFVSTMGTIYGVGGEGDEQSQALGERLRAERDPRTGRPAYTPLTAVGLLVFYVFAMMCMSESAIVARESGGG